MRKSFYVLALIWCGMASGCASGGAAPATAPPAKTVVATILTQALPEQLAAGKEVRILTVEYPPGVASPPHRHPGAIFAYVEEGAVICALDDGKEVRYEKGQAWYERPGQLHRVSRNASATQRARLVVFFLTEPGKPAVEAR